MRRHVLAVLLALPIILMVIGGWEVARAGADRARFDGSGHTGSAASVTAHRTESAGTEADPAADAQTVARVRQALAWSTLVAGGLGGVAGAGGLVSVIRSVGRGRRSRPDLISAFQALSRLLPTVLGTQIVATVVGVTSAVAFEVSALWSVPDPDDRTVLLAILVTACAALVLWAGYETLRNLGRALRAFEPSPRVMSAIPLTESAAPAFFAFLHDIALERGAIMPRTIAVGAEEGFFVSARPALLHASADGDPIEGPGPLLHLPLPVMATLDLEELRTVLAHELAHFAGEDVDYGMRFAPLFGALGQTAHAMSLRRDAPGSTWIDRVFDRIVRPHTELAVFAYEQFGLLVAHWSRVRETEADNAAIASGSSRALASSLLRVALATEASDVARRRFSERNPSGNRDLTESVLLSMETREPADAQVHLGDETPHPTDTHPPTWQRIENVGETVGRSLLMHASRPVKEDDLAALENLLDWRGLSAELTTRFRVQATRSQAAYRAGLAEAAAAGNELVETALRASVLRPAIILAATGTLLLVIAAGCIAAALYGGEQDREAWRFLFGCAAVAGALLGLVALSAIRLWRTRNRPYLVLYPEDFRSPGIKGAVRWVDVAALGVTTELSPTTWFSLNPETQLPERTGAVRRLHVDREARVVKFVGILPRGVALEELRDLLARHVNAAHARHELLLEDVEQRT